MKGPNQFPLSAFSRLYLKVLSAVMLAAALTLVPNLQAEWAWARAEATGSFSGDKVVAVFTFYNSGKKPITVTELKFSCSCTDFSFSATTAAAGETGIVLIVLNESAVEEAKELVAFGSEGTTPTPLTIRVSKPSSGAVPHFSASGHPGGTSL